MDRLRFQFLGTGTSTGVPMIGCDCPVCRSPDRRNRRMRSSLHVQAGPVSFVVDTPPDFREQALQYGLRHLDAVLFTHAHADHIFGFDDIRRFNTLQNNHPIPAYAATETVVELQRIFAYMTRAGQKGLYRPKIRFMPVESSFRIAPLDPSANDPAEAVEIVPFDVIHGTDRTQGFRIDWRGRSLAYAPDCQSLPVASLPLIRGVDIMILDALRYRPHPTHMNIAASLSLLNQIGARRAYLTHLCHDIDHASLSSQLPADVLVSYDGLKVAL